MNIDNEGRLRTDIKYGSDYIFVSYKVWCLYYRWYGCVKGSKIIRTNKNKNQQLGIDACLYPPSNVAKGVEVKEKTHSCIVVDDKFPIDLMAPLSTLR